MEKQRKAEEENDRLRAEKQAKRAETLERINKQREKRIAEQNKQLEEMNRSTTASSQVDANSTSAKPRTKEERKECKFLKPYYAPYKACLLCYKDQTYSKLFCQSFF